MLGGSGVLEGSWVLPDAEVVLFLPVWEDDVVMSRCAVLSLVY